MSKSPESSFSKERNSGALPDPETLLLRDRGLVLPITFEACRLYHGEDSIGGLALGYRLVALAALLLSPGRIPERSEFRFKTAFPGPGFLDALEMTTRAVSRRAVEVILEAPSAAPEGVYGRLYFEVFMGERRLALHAAEGAMSPDFIRTGRAVKKGGADPSLLAHWREVKHALARAVMSSSREKLFVILEQK